MNERRESKEVGRLPKKRAEIGRHRNSALPVNLVDVGANKDSHVPPPLGIASPVVQNIPDQYLQSDAKD
ncbi:uncharacterized protein METZ01_LOCUS336050 [marine metagenome]|uniref:Uncharacterized protein n=1 Tax=marine metagenome TaxID=408172 RepID=A0A382QCM3_9ZZZZ